MPHFASPVSRFVLPVTIFAVTIASGVLASRWLFTQPGHGQTSDTATAVSQRVDRLEIEGLADGGVNLGAQPRGVTRDFTVTIRNPSDSEPVEIKRIAASCTCTAVSGYPLTLGPGASASIPFTIALPGSQLDWGVSLYFVFADGEPSQDVSFDFHLPTPFPEHAVATPGAPMRLPLADLYAGLVTGVACFPRGADDPIAARLTDAADALEIDAPPPGVDRLDLIVTTRSADGSTQRIAQYVNLDLDANAPIAHAAN